MVQRLKAKKMFLKSVIIFGNVTQIKCEEIM